MLGIARVTIYLLLRKKNFTLKNIHTFFSKYSLKNNSQEKQKFITTNKVTSGHRNLVMNLDMRRLFGQVCQFLITKMHAFNDHFSGIKANLTRLNFRDTCKLLASQWQIIHQLGTIHELRASEKTRNCTLLLPSRL